MGENSAHPFVLTSHGQRNSQLQYTRCDSVDFANFVATTGSHKSNRSDISSGKTGKIPSAAATTFLPKN